MDEDAKEILKGIRQIKKDVEEFILSMGLSSFEEYRYHLGRHAAILDVEARLVAFIKDKEESDEG